MFDKLWKVIGAAFLFGLYMIWFEAHEHEPATLPNIVGTAIMILALFYFTWRDMRAMAEKIDALNAKLDKLLRPNDHDSPL